MTTIVEALGKEAAETLKDLCTGTFLHGECYAFAIALHRETDWPIIGLMQGETIHHVAVRSPDGMLYGARGLFSEIEFGEPFAPLSSYDLREISEEDLRARRPVHERVIERALEVAEMLWPEFPWKDSLRSRIMAFADDLEELSRKHGFWICAMPSVGAPVLVRADGEESGYTFTLTDTGLSYCLDRRFGQSE